MRLKVLIFANFLLSACAVSARAGTVTTTAEFRLDLRPSPRVVEPGGSETLATSGRWADPSQTAASVKISLDGADFATFPGTEGSVTWTPSRGGLFTFTHAARGSDGTPYGEVYEAQFLVDNYTFGDGDITASGWSSVYDGQSHSISVTSTVTDATVKYATAQTGPYSMTNPTQMNVGTTTVWYVVEAPFYLPVTNSAAISISERPLTVTAAAKTKVYGTADPALTYTASGLVSGESLTGALVRESGDTVGTYAIQQGTLAASANYALSFTGADFTITKAAIPGADAIKWGVSGAGARFTYDGTEHAVSLTGLPSGVTATYTGNTATDAGDYTATAHLVYDTTNYQTIPDPAPLAWGIDKRLLTVTAAAKTKVYGTADPALTYTADGLVSGESLTGALVRESGDTVGTYAIQQGTLAASANYALSFTGADFTITKAAIPGADAIKWGVSGAGARFTYDGTEHAVSLTGLPSGVTATYTGNTATDAGDYTATAHLVYDTTNYQTISDPAPLAWGIDKRPATVRSADGTWTYDTTAHSKPEVAASGFVTGEGVTARDFASVTDVTPAAGIPNAFAFDWNAGTRAENYDLTVENGTLKVLPRQIGDDPANWDIRLGKNPIYDGTEKTAPIAQVCYVKPDGNLENIPYTVSGNTATDAGNYVLTITGSGNYAGSVTRDWAVMPRNVTFASGSATWTYDGAAHSATDVTVGGDGFAPGEGSDFSGFPAPVHVADAAGGVTNAFAWTFRTGTKASNYEVRATFGTVRMTPRPITLSAPTKTKPYDGTPLTFGAEEIVATLDSGALGERALPEGESFTFSDFASITDAGQCAATFAFASGTAKTGDYAITVAEGATLTVTRSAAEIVVQAGSETWIYDGAAHSNRTWTATNLDTLVAGDRLVVAFDATSVATSPIDGPEGNGSVTNRIAEVRILRANGTDVTANYALSWYPGMLRVTPRPVLLASADATKTYDGTPLVAHEAAVGSLGFVETDGATFSFTGSRTEKGSSANTFSWAFKPGTNPAFYDVTTAEGTLTVTALDIGGGGDSDWTVELGPALTYNGIEQIQTVRAATFRGLPVDYAVEDDRATDAGDYALTLVGQGNFTGHKTVPWSIAPKALALAAGSATKVYDGTPLVCGDVTATGFVAGEGATFVCSGSRTDAGVSANAVGEIRWAAGTKGTNYAVSKTAGTLAVTKRPVTLTAPTKTKPYDGTPLTFGAGEIEATLTGGPPGERALPEGESLVYSDFACITDAGQCTATFAYAAGPDTNLANYDVTVAPGATLTVTGSATEITVIADSASWVFDGAAHAAPTYTTVNAETLTAGDALVVAFAEGCSVTHATDGLAGDGVVTNRIASVRVLRGGEGGADVTRNYTIKTYDGTLRVTKRPVTVRVAGHRTEATFDGAEHAAEGYDIETDDALYDLADVSFSGMARVARTNAGTTGMGLSAGQFSNNDGDFAVTFAVTDGGVTVAPADISGDGAFVVTLGENPLYNGTVQTIEVRSVTWNGLPVAHSLAGERATHAGTYALTVKGTGNFTGERTTSWAIRRRTVTLASASDAKVYDGQPLRNATVTVGGDGFIGSEGAVFDVTGSRTVVGESANAFTYALKAGTLAGDYDISTAFGTLTVRKATHDVTGLGWNAAADSATFLYDGAVHGVALTGLPPGVMAVYAGNVATNAGNYTATAHLVYDTENYEPIADPAPLAWSVTRRPVTLFAASKDKPYDGWPLEVRPEDITVAGSGYAPGECFAYGDFASITDVGEIPATFSYADSATAKVSNYDVTVQGGQTLKITVGGDQISVTADSGVWAYDGETHRKEGWTFVNGDKLLDGHAFDIAIAADSAVTTPAEGIVSNRFDHVKIVESASGRDMTRNYNLFVYEGTLQVTNALIAPCMALHRTVQTVYDGMPHSAAVEAPTLLQPATVRYRVGDGGWATAAPEWTHAGTYEALFEVSARFYDPATGTVQVAISPRPVTLSSPTKIKPYDGTPLTFAADEIGATLTGGPPGGLAPPDGALGERALPEGESFVYSDFASITDAGRIDATFSWLAGPGTSAADYAVTVRKGTLTVSRSATEIVVTAKDGEWVFDGTAHSLHEWTAENIDTLAAGDALEVTFDPASAIAEPGEAANTITGVRVLRGTADVSANYALSWWPGTLRVTPASIAPSVAPNVARYLTYDGSGHAVAVAAPTLLTTPVTVRYAATADGPWGTTPVPFTDAGAWTSFFRIEAPCYDPHVGTATMTIAPREVTLVSAGATKVYDGSPLQTNSVSVKAGSLLFVAGEGFSATCSGTVTDVGGVENAFDYALTGGAKADNYTIRKEYGWLRVTPATMDVEGIAANAGWRGVYDGAGHCIDVGVPYPRAVVTYALESGNEEAYGSTNPTWKNVSSNTVFFKILAPNYEPGYGEAAVEIGKRSLSVTAEPKTKVFGAADPALTYTVSNLVSGDSVSGKLVRESGEAVGTYEIRQGTLSAGENYAIAFTGATFEITPGGIVVDANAGAMGYTGEYDGTAHGAALRVVNPATGAAVQWSESAAGPWTDASPAYMDAGTNTVWWRVSAPNFQPLSGTARVIVTPRPISKATVGTLTNEWYTGYPVEPVPSVTDTVPITADDWTMRWDDNVEPGTARAIVCGRRNYGGEAAVPFEIVLKPVVVIVIDLSNVEVGQGKWGTASVSTNGVPVDVAAGSRVELEIPQGTSVALSFAPDPGFKIGSVIVDRRRWTTQAEWSFEAKADRSFQASYIPNPQTTVRWKKANATGHYHGQFAMPWFAGYEEALSGLRFLFADREQNGAVYAQLWDYSVPSARRVASETEIDGKTYRFVPLGSPKTGAASGTRAVWGVSDATLASAVAAVPSAERLIGLYIRKRISPVSGEETDAGVENFIGALSWETNGKTYYQPVGAGYENGIIAEKILDAVDLDTAEALGFDPAFLATAEPGCRFTDFSFDPLRGIGGTFEIYAATPDGIEAVSSGTTANAVFHLWGTEKLGGEWTEIARAEFPEEAKGSVRFANPEVENGESRFFLVTIEVKATHE